MNQFNQFPIPFHLHAALAQRPGSEVTTHLAPYERRRGYYTTAELRDSEGNLIQRASGPSVPSALYNLDTALSLR